MTSQKRKGKVSSTQADRLKETKMSNQILNQLEQDLAAAVGRVSKIKTAIEAVRALEGTEKPSRKGVSPAGARKSIFHPNQFDVKVLDAMISFTATEEMPKLQMDWISKETEFEKTDVQRAIKWLNSANLIETIGRGRGTHYKALVTSNDLTVVDESELEGNYRRSGGPTVKQIVRAIFNGLEPATRLSPAKVNEIAQELYPESRLTRQSFGQVFTKMAEAGELFFEGDGRSRQYWRGMDLLEGAAEAPEGFDFDRFFATTEETSTDETEDNSSEGEASDEQSSEESDDDAVAV